MQLGRLQLEEGFPEKQLCTQRQQPVLFHIVLAQPVCLEEHDRGDREYHERYGYPQPVHGDQLCAK